MQSIADGTAVPAAGGRSFRPPLILTLVTVAALALLLSLGTWQVRRLAWKEDLIATATGRLSEAPVALPAAADWSVWDFRRVTLRGSYRHTTALAFGLTAQGQQIGADLLTPLTLDDGRTLLVDRGWLPEAQLPPAVPAALEAAGSHRVDGVLRWRGDAARNRFTPDDDPVRRRVFGYDWPTLERLAGSALLPVVVQLAASDGAGGLPRPAAAAVEYRNPHLGYAVTWYGLAAALVAVYVAFVRRQRGG